MSTPRQPISPPACWGDAEIALRALKDALKRTESEFEANTRRDPWDPPWTPQKPVMFDVKIALSSAASELEQALKRIEGDHKLYIQSGGDTA